MICNENNVPKKINEFMPTKVEGTIFEEKNMVKKQYWSTNLHNHENKKKYLLDMDKIVPQEDPRGGRF